MKQIFSFLLLLPFMWATPAAALLYPQRAQQQPAVAAPTQPTQGYNIHAGRDYAATPRPIQIAPVPSYADQGEWIDIPMQPATQTYVVPTPIEAQPITATLGNAAASFNTGVKYTGTLEAGLQYSTGNSELQDYNAKAEIERDSLNWTNRAMARFALTEADGEPSEEEYRGELESQYKLSDVDFLFGEIDAERDLFSGYEYRINEVLGYGRKWVNGDAFKWHSKVGAGFQHYEEEGQDREDAPVGRFENDLEWQIAETLSLENNIRVDVSDLTAVRTETAIKNQLMGALFLKLAVITNYLSDVPAGSEDTDIDTMVNLSYEFD